MTRPTQFGGPFHFPYQRVIVTGANGAGKTWFAQRVAKTADLPWVNNDALSLKTGWQYRAKADIQALQDAAVSKDAWILDGGPSLIRPALVTRADLVIWLDPPAIIRLRRIVWRTLCYLGRTRPEHPQGNVEWPGRRQFRFLVKARKSDARIRDHLSEVLPICGTPYMRLCGDKQVDRFLADPTVYPTYGPKHKTPQG